MEIIHEEVNGIHYLDIILFSDDIEKMQTHEMISYFHRLKYTPYYIGVRIDEGIQYEKRSLATQEEEED